MKMTKEKTVPPVNLNRDAKDFSEQSLAILMKEYDTLRELYTQAESNAQNIFNFYLTLVTTVIGGVVVISQFSSSNTFGTIKSQLLIMGIIFFAAIVGSIYSAALSARYANMTRYAYCMNEIRKILLKSVNVPLPSFYESFLKSRANLKTRKGFWHTLNIWLAPTGTYHFFISMINSACLSIVLLLFLNIAGFVQNNLNQSIIVSLLVFTILYLTHNFYSVYTMLRMISNLTARVGTGRDIESVFQES